MMPEMNKPREGVAAVVSNDGKRLYAVGGKSGGRLPAHLRRASRSTYHTHSTAEVFEDGSWRMLEATMSVGREGLGAVITPQDVIYAIGGWDNARLEILNSVERLDTSHVGTKPSSSGWELCSNVMTRRRDYTSAAIAPDGSLVFAVGGRSCTNPKKNENTVDVLRLDDMVGERRLTLSFLHDICGSCKMPCVRIHSTSCVHVHHKGKQSTARVEARSRPSLHACERGNESNWNNPRVISDIARSRTSCKKCSGGKNKLHIGDTVFNIHHRFLLHHQNHEVICHLLRRFVR